MKIELGKTYLTRASNKVRIICTDRKSEIGAVVVGLVADGKSESMYTYYPDGNYFGENGNSSYDLVKEYSFWNDVKIDTKILVRDYESDEWIPAYFAGYNKGFIQSFPYGATSWSSRKNKTNWKYAKLVEKNN